MFGPKAGKNCIEIDVLIDKLLVVKFCEKMPCVLEIFTIRFF